MANNPSRLKNRHDPVETSQQIGSSADHAGETPTVPTQPRVTTLTLPEQIAQNIADAIVTGTYPPGARIIEQNLADLFSVSRGPIREALRILEKDGLIKILPRRGALVTCLTRSEVTDIFLIRANLMGLAAQLAAERATHKQRKELSKATQNLSRLAKGADVNEFVHYAANVSMLLPQISNNARLYSHLASMAYLTLPLTHMALSDHQNRKIWSQNWHATVEAIHAKDGEAANRAATRLVIEQGEKAVTFAPEDQSTEKKIEVSSSRHMSAWDAFPPLR